MISKFFYLFILSLTFTSCVQKEFNVFFDDDTTTQTYHTYCGTIELEVSQSYDQLIYLEAKCDVSDTLTFYKDSIKIIYRNNMVPIYEISKDTKLFGFKTIDAPIANLKSGDLIAVGCFLKDSIFNYPDTIHVFTKGAFYYKENPIEIEKINIIVKN